MFGFAAPSQSRLGSIAGQAQQLASVGQQQQATGLQPGGMSALTRGAGQPPMLGMQPQAAAPSGPAAQPGTPQAGTPQPSAPLSAPPAAPQAYNLNGAFQMPGDVNMGARGNASVQLDSPSYGAAAADGGGSIFSTIASLFGG